MPWSVVEESPEAAVRWKAAGRPVDSPLREEIRRSARVRQLLAGASGRNIYAKWQGAHWVLLTLADLGYPPGDEALHPLRDQVLDAWLDDRYFRLAPVDGRYRAHASQPGGALWALVTLGLADARCDRLAELLLRWQWPDGGWNCDRHRAARTSSFMETLLPMRGLRAYGVEPAARAAAEVFLARRLAFRASTGELIRADFAALHYPLYWHYDILGGLTAMAELGLLADARCADALDVLESRRLPDGRPAHRSFARPLTAASNRDVDWGGTSTRRANPWVTAGALTVLHAAGRLPG